MMKLIKMSVSLITVACIGFLIHSAWSDTADIYDAPRPPVDPSTPEKACYNALTDCVQDCDRMFPAPYVYEPNEDFTNCVKLCNKTANMCISEMKR